jgi:hypothetical protein
VEQQQRLLAEAQRVARLRRSVEASKAQRVAKRAKRGAQPPASAGQRGRK